MQSMYATFYEQFMEQIEKLRRNSTIIEQNLVSKVQGAPGERLNLLYAPRPMNSGNTTAFS